MEVAMADKQSKESKERQADQGLDRVRDREHKLAVARELLNDPEIQEVLLQERAAMKGHRRTDDDDRDDADDHELAPAAEAADEEINRLMKGLNLVP
jgi:hypothetical protein